MTPAGESNKGDTSGACLMIFSFRLFQLGYLAVISAESVSHFFSLLCCSSLPLSESISLPPVDLSARCSLTLSVGLFGLVVVEASLPTATAAKCTFRKLQFERECSEVACRGTFNHINAVRLVGKLPRRGRGEVEGSAR